MTKQEITKRLIENHQKFTTYIPSLDDKDFMFSLNNERWAAGQQLDHIYRSLSPLNVVLRFPRWTISMFFGKTNRPSKSYDQLVSKYLRRLEAGGKASGRYIPKRIDLDQRTTITNKIENSVSKLCELLDRFSEQEIDELILPHPILGKLTLREMMYFTICHVEHHHKIAMRNLENK